MTPRGPADFHREALRALAAILPPVTRAGGVPVLVVPMDLLDVRAPYLFHTIMGRSDPRELSDEYSADPWGCSCSALNSKRQATCHACGREWPDWYTEPMPEHPNAPGVIL